MRKPTGRYLRIESVDWVGHRSAIGFEELEHRLTLSAAPLALDHAADIARFVEPSADTRLVGGQPVAVAGQYDSVAQHTSDNFVATYDAAPSDSAFGTAAPSPFGGNAGFGSTPGAGIPPAGLTNFAAGSIDSQHAYGIESYALTSTQVAGTATVVSFYGPNVVVTFLFTSNNNSAAPQKDLTEDGGQATAYAATDSVPYAHVDGPQQPAPGNAGRNSNSAASGSVAAFAVDSVARVPASAGDAAKSAIPAAPSAPVLPSQITQPGGGADDAGVARGPLAQPQVPQSMAGVLQTPEATVPQVSPNVQGSAGAATAPAEQNGGVAGQETPIAATTAASSAGVAEGHGTTLQIDVSRAALLASVPLDLAAVDQALATMFNEIERLGGELVSWLDEASAQPWVAVVTVAAASWLGGRHVLRRRAGRLSRDHGEEESSSWLFTRMNNPAGQA